ncbi:MAG: menaquinone via futalosine step 1 [Campylobacter sp.]|nr:menaquinone via futalosine step 1 [Campylobacter sp.]
MKFGKIDYLNLLPFHVFLKSYRMPNAAKMAIEHKKGVPSKLNKELYAMRIDAAVISSIQSRHKKYKKLNFGIVAKGDVKSVLVRKNTPTKLDPASASSNMLRKILGLNGEVVIGDRALKAYLKDGDDSFYDLGRIWQQKYNLPFVFGRFCYTNNGSFYKTLVDDFLKTKVKIPQYILQDYAKSRGIKPSDIKWYLNFISYKMGKKEQKSVRMFITKARKLNFKAE